MLPEVCAYQRYEPTARSVFILCECPAEDRLHSNQIEEIETGRNHRDRMRLINPAHDHCRNARAHNLLEAGGALAPIEVDTWSSLKPLLAAQLSGLHYHQSFRVRIT